MENFKLPEKWYIKPTKETNDILEKWRGGGYSGPMEDIILLSDKYWKYKNYKVSNEYTEITFDQFKEFVLKEKKMYSIQDLKNNPNLVVRCTSSEQGNKVANEFLGYGYIHPNQWRGSRNFIIWYKSNKNFSWDFIEYKKSEQTIIEFNQVNFNEMNKEIIGYKVPYDLFKGFPEEIKAGTIMVSYQADNMITNAYRKVGSKFSPFRPFPKEIVETWEPVYEENLYIDPRDKSTLVNFRGDSIIVNGIAYSKQSLQSLKTIMEKGQIQSLNVGCSGQYKVDLNLLNKILEKLN